MILKKTQALLGAGVLDYYFQTKHDAVTGAIVGAEALSRYITKDGEVILPFRYIPEFQTKEEIAEFDFFTLGSVLSFLGDWQNNDLINDRRVPVSVNFSKSTFERENFFKRFEQTTSSYNINPELINIEITESNRFRDFAYVSKVVGSLREKGYGVSIDDYGMNSSAFSIIRHVDVDVLKVDRELIVLGESDRKTRIIFESAVDLAKKLNISVVAEGVETESQLQMARDIGCDTIQGWYFSKPMPKEKFFEFVAEY